MVLNKENYIEKIMTFIKIIVEDITDKHPLMIFDNALYFASVRHQLLILPEQVLKKYCDNPARAAELMIRDDFEAATLKLKRTDPEKLWGLVAQQINMCGNVPCTCKGNCEVLKKEFMQKRQILFNAARKLQETPIPPLNKEFS